MASPEDPKFVVAIDFGTTFSKAAYAESSSLDKGSFAIDKMVHLITDWPSQQAGGGGKTFMTKSCVWYMPGPEVGTFELKGWGWDAYVKYKEHVQSLAKPDCWVSEDMLSKRHGYLIDCFKLHLYNCNAMEELPKCLPLHKVISDFLRGMSTFILQELRLKHGRKVFKRDIQWCITVPSLWEEHHKQTMEDCAEIAGLVRGPLCTDNSVGIYDLITVLEPEAASIYCHNTLGNTLKSSGSGDTFVVADLGGGTTDLVTHKRIGRTRRSNIRVKEISWSIGGLFGGVNVDEQFLQHLRNEINYPNFECFSEFENLYPSHVLDLLLQWGRIKTEYKGEIELSKVYFLDLPITLAKMWKRSHRLYLLANRLTSRDHRLRDYHRMELNSGDVKKMFDKDIEAILRLIKKTNKENVDFFLIVGGFSESPYVRERIKQGFSKDCIGFSQEKEVSRVIFPRDPDTAVVRGAVALGVHGEWESFVQSRIAKKTYGFDTTVPFDAKLHPPQHLVYDQQGSMEKYCDKIFQPFVRRGEEVPFNSVVEYSTCPLYRQGYPDDDNITISMYSTDAINPKFIEDKGVTEEAACTIHVPRGVPCRGKGKARGEGPRLKISVHFGGTRIRLSVWGTNFSCAKVAMPPVRFISAAQNEREYQELLQKIMKNPGSESSKTSKTSKRKRD